VTRTPAQAVAYARTIHSYPRGYCLRFVRVCFDVGSKYPSAISAWNNAEQRHATSTPPYGAPVFFAPGGSNPYGHVAMSVGGGRCRSTDWPRAGVVSEVSISELAAAWRHPYLGWTNDLNGVLVVPTNSSFPLEDGHSFGRYSSASVWNGTEGPVTAERVKRIQRRVSVGQTGRYGPVTELAVKAWQKWKGLPVTGRVGQTTWDVMFPPS
jgi:hypothetical protein